MIGCSKKKVLVFGGSFDPPHLGHMGLLRGAVRLIEPDSVVVVPAGIAPHKAASATPAALRLEMCRCFLPLFPGLVIDEGEVKSGEKSYTIDTLRRLRQRYPDGAFYLCVGGDMLLGFTAWRQWRQILEMAVLVAAGREDDPAEAVRLEEVAADLRRQGGTVLFTGEPVLEVSSSGIRRAISAGQKDVYRQIPPPADDIVRGNHLYG